MITLLRSCVLDVPAQRAWAVLRDFAGLGRWHPAFNGASIERSRPADAVGCVRSARLVGQGVLREQLLALSDADMCLSYCLLETPLPLFNFVAHLRLCPVTDAQRSFVQWSARFDTQAESRKALTQWVQNELLDGGLQALRSRFEQPANDAQP